MRYSNWVNDAFYQTHPCLHWTVINRFKNYCFSIQMGVASGFQGLDSVRRDAWKRGDERTKGAKMEEEGGCRKGEKESGSLAEAFMPKFAQRTFRGSFVIFHEKAL